MYKEMKKQGNHLEHEDCKTSKEETKLESERSSQF